MLWAWLQAVPEAPHLAVPFWNLGTILALLIQAGAIVRWGTRIEERLTATIKTLAETERRLDERMVVIERNGSPAVKTLGQHLNQEQTEIERILAMIERNYEEIVAMNQRIVKLETACALHHGTEAGRR